MRTRCPVCHAPIDGASLRLDVRDGESSGFCRLSLSSITLTADDLGAMARAMDPDDEGRPLDRALGEE